MSFVPVITPPPQPSRRARELGNRIQVAIEEYRREDPQITPGEIHQALRLAETQAPGGRSRAALVALTLGAMLLLGLYFVMRGEGPGEMATMPLVAIAVVVIGLLGVLVAARRR